jgi:SHAQKYF class myb-like DNA-binding protein
MGRTSHQSSPKSTYYGIASHMLMFKVPPGNIPFMKKGTINGIPCVLGSTSTDSRSYEYRRGEARRGEARRTYLISSGFRENPKSGSDTSARANAKRTMVIQKLQIMETSDGKAVSSASHVGSNNHEQDEREIEKPENQNNKRSYKREDKGEDEQESKKERSIDAREDSEEDLHRAFVAAIFDIGLSSSSPSVIMENMNSHPQSMTSEIIKSHLQKFRKSREKEKCKFLEDYVTCMQTKSRIGALAPSSVDKIIIGSKVAAFLSLSVMKESEPKKEGESAPSKILAQGFVQGVNEAGFPAAHIPFPELSKEEKKSPLGTSLMFAMGLMKHLEQYVVQESRNQGHMPLQEEEPIKQPSETCLASQHIVMDEPGPRGMTSSPLALSQEIDLLDRSHSHFPPSDIADYASMSATFPTRAQRHLPTSTSFEQFPAHQPLIVQANSSGFNSNGIIETSRQQAMHHLQRTSSALSLQDRSLYQHHAPPSYLLIPLSGAQFAPDNNSIYQSYDSQLRTELTAAECSLQEQMLQDTKMHHMQTQLPGENPSDQKSLETSKHRSAGHFGRFFPVVQGQMDLAIAVQSQPQNQPDTFPMSQVMF